MGILERRARQKNEIRNGILRSAWKMVLEDGWQSLSIRKIADAIEYSVPVVYEHFSNKEAILSEFNREGYQLLAKKLKTAKGDKEGPEQQLEAIAYAYCNFAFDQQAYYQLMFGLGMPSCACVRKVPELMDFIEVISSCIEKIITDKNNSEELHLKVRSFWSTLHGLVSISFLSPDQGSQEICQEKLNSLVLKDFLEMFINRLKNQ